MSDVCGLKAVESKKIDGSAGWRGLTRSNGRQAAERLSMATRELGSSRQRMRRWSEEDGRESRSGRRVMS